MWRLLRRLAALVVLATLAATPAAGALGAGLPEEESVRVLILISDRFDDHGNRRLGITLGFSNSTANPRPIRVHIEASTYDDRRFDLSECPAWLAAPDGLGGTQTTLEGMIPGGFSGRAVINATAIQAVEPPFVIIGIDGAALSGIDAGAHLTCSPGTARFSKAGTYMQIAADGGYAKLEPLVPRQPIAGVVEFKQTEDQLAAFRGGMVVVSMFTPFERVAPPFWPWLLLTLAMLAAVGIVGYRAGRRTTAAGSATGQ